MSSKTNSGISWAGVLFIIFLTLKLTNNISWSWIWVTCPLWAPLALFIGSIFVAFLVIITLLVFGVSIDKITNKIEIFKKTLTGKD